METLAISYHEGEDGMLYPDIKAAGQTETGTLVLLPVFPDL